MRKVAREVDGVAGLLQFDDQAAAAGAMDQAVEWPGRCSDAASEAARQVEQGIREVGGDFLAQVTVDRFDRPADEVVLQSQERGGVAAGLDDYVVRLPQQQECPVRLDRSGEVNLLAFAIGQVCLPKGWRR